MKELEIKMTKDLYVIVSKKMGKALTDRVYLTELILPKRLHNENQRNRKL